MMFIALTLATTSSHWFLDNIFIERLWGTLKYECVYLHAWEAGSETKAAIRKWMTFYNPASLRPSLYAFEVNRFC